MLKENDKTISSEKKRVTESLQSKIDNITDFAQIGDIISKKENEFMYLAYLVNRRGGMCLDDMKEKADSYGDLDFRWDYLIDSGYSGQCWDSSHPDNMDEKYMQWDERWEKWKYRTARCRVEIHFSDDNKYNYSRSSILDAINRISGFKTGCGGSAGFAYFQADMFLADFKLYRDSYEDYLLEHAAMEENLDFINFENRLSGLRDSTNTVKYKLPSSVPKHSQR